MKNFFFFLVLLFEVFSLQSQRIETNFNNSWNFILADNSSFLKENIDDSSWQNLNVPHDWSFEKGVRKGGDQGQGGGYHDGGSDDD